MPELVREVPDASSPRRSSCWRRCPASPRTPPPETERSKAGVTRRTETIKQPIWFEVYEAFPPKYEPRFDRHQLPYGEGGNVEAMGPPRKIFYKEDLIRAQF